MIKINVIINNTHWLDFIKNPNHYINRKINKINLIENKFKKKSIFCTLLLSGNKEIKYLNKKFRKKNKITDVLSFPFYSKATLNKKLRIDKEVYLGDIIINLNKVKNKNNIKKFKMDFDRIWVHGLIHLFGHDHKKNKDFLKMKLVEERYYNLINGK